MGSNSRNKKHKKGLGGRVISYFDQRAHEDDVNRKWSLESMKAGL